jgi:hypothetical protein
MSSLMFMPNPQPRPARHTAQALHSSQLAAIAQPHTAGRSPCVEAKFCRNSPAEILLVGSQAAYGGAVYINGINASRQSPQEGAMAWIAEDREAILAQAGRSRSERLSRASLHMRCSGWSPALSSDGRIHARQEGSMQDSSTNYCSMCSFVTTVALMSLHESLRISYLQSGYKTLNTGTWSRDPRSATFLTRRST